MIIIIIPIPSSWSMIFWWRTFGILWPKIEVSLSALCGTLRVRPMNILRDSSTMAWTYGILRKWNIMIDTCVDGTRVKISRTRLFRWKLFTSACRLTWEICHRVLGLSLRAPSSVPVVTVSGREIQNQALSKLSRSPPWKDPRRSLRAATLKFISYYLLTRMLIVTYLFHYYTLLGFFYSINNLIIINSVFYNCAMN